mmetsp:Transcript_12646/g.27817  ORF Transcript_12646/g.27817 Transcript_12646/m.27817 type:complete len:607 (+) Transcript_12646:99-1919(+)
MRKSKMASKLSAATVLATVSLYPDKGSLAHRNSFIRSTVTPSTRTVIPPTNTNTHLRPGSAVRDDADTWHARRCTCDDNHDRGRIWQEIPRGGVSKDPSSSSEKSDSSPIGKDQPNTRPKTSRKKKSRQDPSKPDRKSSGRSSSSSEETKKKDRKQSSANAESQKSKVRNKDDDKDADLPPIATEILKQDDYYEILGIQKSTVASQSPDTANATIKKAYRRRALLTHPDKLNGDRRAFDKVAEAYDVLSDQGKRTAYNRFGKAGLQQENGVSGGGSGFHPAGFSTAEDLFRSFFGASGSGGNHPFSRRNNRTVRYQLEVTLEDMYHGVTRSILVSGGGSHMMRQHHDDSHNSKRVEVTIPKGALDGQTLVLSGEMDLDPNETPGDLVFDLQQRKHRTFTRKGFDLAFTLNIRLRDAIAGVEQKIRHLNGKDLHFQSARHKSTSEDGQGDPIMIRDGDVQVLKGYGMPKDAQGEEYGDLYVQYKVAMPRPRSTSSLTKEEKLQLSQLLDKLEGHHEHNRAGASSFFHKKDTEEVLQMKRAALADFGRASGIPQMPQHDEHHEHNDNPFGRQSQFYFSSSSGNPFFGMHQGMFSGQRDMDEEAQCQQM